MPDSDTRINTKNGEAFCQKVDIFKEVMWFAYPSNSANWYKISVQQVKEMIALNKGGKVIDNIEDYTFEEENKSINNVITEDSLSRFDEPRRKKRSPRNKKKSVIKTEPARKEKATASKEAVVNAQSSSKAVNNKQGRGKIQRNSKNKPTQTNKQAEQNSTVASKSTESQRTSHANKNRKKNFRKSNKNNGNKPNSNPDDSKQ